MSKFEKEFKTTLWVEGGVTRMRAYRSDFTGSTEEWKRSFYEIWRYQMTWDFAYEIRVHEVSDGDICVDLLVKDAYLNHAKDMMKYLGYGNVRCSSEHIGVVELYDINDEDLFTVVAD